MDSLSPSSAGPPADAAARLDRFAAFFEGMTAADVGRLGEIYAEDVHFADPFSDFRGLEDLRRVFAAMFDGMRDYALSVDEMGMIAADTGMVRWTMSGFVRALGREPWIVHGVSASTPKGASANISTTGTPPGRCTNACPSSAGCCAASAAASPSIEPFGGSTPSRPADAGHPHPARGRDGAGVRLDRCMKNRAPLAS
jgi:hypothetical protein